MLDSFISDNKGQALAIAVIAVLVVIVVLTLWPAAKDTTIEIINASK